MVKNRQVQSISGAGKSHSESPTKIASKTEQPKATSTESLKDNSMTCSPTSVSKPAITPALPDDDVRSVSNDQSKSQLQQKKQPAIDKSLTGQKLGNAGPKLTSSGKSSCNRAVTPSGIDRISKQDFHSFNRLNKKKGKEAERKRQEDLREAMRRAQSQPEKSSDTSSEEDFLKNFDFDAAINTQLMQQADDAFCKSLSLWGNGVST